ncbi:MAG: lysophospholipid acyltransferase family protein [Candidatus Calescibacterium sp.]|nr:1-acyl-sn-glycerol-3-phosphate acyltransferase [Candidatus Calescibacterium sp.]MCX7972344.1 1-acyl-sn-glycerol-3-phosphate acyltransferase [bacterium]MDW8195935.1 lysophospholipid acyltransferase family protein [Candidatus Calescibacterium sp.]
MGKIFLKIFFRLEVEGIEKIPKQGPLILISNHHSYLDPPVIVSTFPRRIHFVAKKELFLHPLTSLFVKLFDSIPVDRGHTKPSTFKTIFRYLSNQEVICIFPEGTRVNNPENFGKAERGIGFIVSKSQAPVLITYIDGTYQWYKKFKIKVIFKELVTFEQLSKIEESKIPEFLMKKVYHDKN